MSLARSPLLQGAALEQLQAFLRVRMCVLVVCVYVNAE